MCDIWFVLFRSTGITAPSSSSRTSLTRSGGPNIITRLKPFWWVLPTDLGPGYTSLHWLATVYIKRRISSGRYHDSFVFQLEYLTDYSKNPPESWLISFIVIFQPSNYEEFTSQLYDTECSERLMVDRPDGLPVKAEMVTVDVSGATFSRMTDYRRWAAAQ